MPEIRKMNTVVPAVAVFVGLPVLFWALGDFPRRTVLKESFSMGTLLAFSLMLGLFFLTRGSRNTVTHFTMRTTVTLHKVIGYIVVAVLLLHPFFIVIPRYFESGIAPKEAFITMVTTWESPGVVLGIIAWCLMLILGVTSLLRKRLPMKYTTWRIMHGILAILFVVLATWHAIDLGRHTDRAMSTCMIVLAGCGILLLVKTYILKPSKDRKDASQ
jgi:predicted ferric reductase